jgi:hypothetical protein
MDLHPYNTICHDTTRHDKCTVGALLVLERATNKLRLTKLTTARTWEATTFPLYYTLWLAMGPTSKWRFVPRLPSGSPEIPKVGTPATLGVDIFVFKPPIGMRFQEML